MDLTSVKNIKNLLSQRGLRPSKGLGQNFLIDKGTVMKIIEAADLQPDDTVLEIGPGLGTLTQELAGRVKKVIAVEKDWNMAEILKETLKDFKNVEVINEDIRRSDFLIQHGMLNEKTFHVNVGKSDFQNYKVVGNLPFYLTAPLIRQFLELAKTRSPQMTLVVQKEVAQRICSKPPDMNLLTVSVQFYAEPKIISYLSKNSFWPSPEVDAAIIKITPINSKFPKPRQTPGVDEKTPGVKSVSEIDKSLFFKIVRAGFSHPRKQLINNLSLGLGIGKEKTREWLLENGIQPNQRAETLSIDNWRNLTHKICL